jgi:hypothetical protein
MLDPQREHNGIAETLYACCAVERLMAISQSDIKLLWGRSGNLCAICHCRLSHDSKHASRAFPLGEQAHIVAREPDGARGTSILSPEDRDKYTNLILLCPNHHTEIDRRVADFPVEKLHALKGEHELWVQSQLARATDLREVATDLIYTNVIDATVEACQLAIWEQWTSWALSANPSWPADAPSRIFDFYQKVLRTPWPRRHAGLEHSLQVLAEVMLAAINHFVEHAEPQGDRLRAVRFYKIPEFDRERYSRLLREFGTWQSGCHALVREATRAVNWFADCVRRDINPLFFAEKGRFLVTQGPDENLSFGTSLLQYSEPERAELPARLDERLREIRSS